MSTSEGPRPDLAQFPLSYPLPPVATPDPPPRPREVTVAFWCTLVGAALFMVSISLSFGSMEFLREAVRSGYVEEGASFTESDVRTRATWVALFYYVVAVILTAPFITFAALARGGRNWARIVLTVFVAIGGVIVIILIFPPYDAAPYPLALRIVYTLLAGTSVVIVLLMHTGSANQYFAASRPRY